jgi:hypothetical protein
MGVAAESLQKQCGQAFDILNIDKEQLMSVFTEFRLTIVGSLGNFPKFGKNSSLIGIFIASGSFGKRHATREPFLPY